MSKLIGSALLGAAWMLAPMLAQAQTAQPDAQYAKEMAQCIATQESCQDACPELRSFNVRYPEPECAHACWDVSAECETTALEALEKRAEAKAETRSKITVSDAPKEEAEEEASPEAAKVDEEKSEEDERATTSQ